MKKTWRIHIKGQVQGVGFRPFVYQQAKEMVLKGWVNNTMDGVHCEFNANEKASRQFYQLLINNAPSLADITAHNLQEIAPKPFKTFQIIHSDVEGERNLLITPDFAMCADCRKELFDSQNRREHYPFITCTNCGPRYSIIETLPYDRETTTMGEFPMCEACKKEYWNPLERRYYSQTNSCGSCGIAQTLFDKEQQPIASETEAIVQTISKQWNSGKITAIKGVGGYLLACDAANAAAIQTLRDRKQRPSKPFALMYPDLQSIKQDLILRDKEEEMLLNHVSPIILLRMKGNPASNIQHLTSSIQTIAPGLTRLGVMIPYTPLYALLMKAFGRPIVATSGNITHSPIMFRNDKALDELTDIADLVLTNNRDIVVPQDDSVITFTPKHRQKIIYRRSRGLAPSYINSNLALPETMILAAGAMLKSTFTYLHRQNIFVSQYLGDLEHFDTQKNYRQIVNHFFDLFDEKPEVILADKHPNYFSTRFATQLSDELDVPLKKYQHHIAHFAAVLGEHNLIDTDEPVLGVIWDGTGLGNDDQIWGGEFFIYDDYQFNRCAHFDYFDFILGDKMPREPRISALAATKNCQGTVEILREHFSDYEWKNYHTLLQKPDNLHTSSVGRLFDAAASLLDIKQVTSFEGEAPMLLEAQAQSFIDRNGPSFAESYPLSFHGQAVSTKMLLQGMIDDLQSGKRTGAIAAKFHYSMASLIAEAAKKVDIRKIVLSGGVFQNALLVDMIYNALEEQQRLYFHKAFSPNDENISFGQLMCYLIEERGRLKIYHGSTKARKI
jgi:hydrogenase maturation protein HypF